MSARILELPRSRRGSTTWSDAGAALAGEAERLHFWRGASGRCYVHSVYSLIECPPLPAANYVLARRDANGRTVALVAGRVEHTSATLNLAGLRQLGASLGASEVHIHLLTSSDHDARMVELDVEAALLCPCNANDAGDRPAFHAAAMAG